MKKLVRLSAIFFLFVLGVFALLGSWGFIMDPSGKSIGIPLELLAETAFKDYLIPGIILLLAIAIPSLVIAVLAMAKIKHYAWLVLIQGCVLFAWITIELMINIDFHHPALTLPTYAMAILLIVLGFFMKKRTANG